ncbi:hypothetical protein P170DRAFT_215670 [Aspergillus steynii IBT 23096]|uniref:Uncharacterized protein n=1 Tax=Aspergillus steynii IBT 23096 TaxID=1392250 RepID=A0A2I2G0K3_9EURO|nr:uncharacterized protein P170DRAFT_215670 [Aspergillus steynii IBT 23096]PLB46411.1 hypothetical protein P170DRAFT_215670 [Aspergillus steynii IBT 23096]
MKILIENTLKSPIGSMLRSSSTPPKHDHRGSRYQLSRGAARFGGNKSNRQSNVRYGTILLCSGWFIFAKRTHVEMIQTHVSQIGILLTVQPVKPKKRTFLSSILCYHRGDRHPAQESRHYDTEEGQSNRVNASASLQDPRNSIHRAEDIEDRAKLTEEIDTIFWEQNKHQNLDSHRHLAQCDFIYDALIFTENNQGQIRRRLVVDFETDVNLMADDVQKHLNIKVDPYTGPTIQLPGQLNVQPIGSVVTRWKLQRGNKIYQTRFLIIENSRSDLLLGRPSVKELALFRVDPEIVARLQASYH